MKKLVLLLAIISFVSCDDFLNKGPLTTLSEASYWKQGSDAEYAVNGLYAGFYEFDGGGAFATDASPDGSPYLDLCTDLMFLKNPWEFGFTDFNTGSLTADNGWISNFWSTKYRYIRNCNFFFDNIDKVKDLLTPEQYSDYCGQARVIRAFLYLRLVQGFGDVPLITKTLSPDEWPTRTPVDDVMKFIFDELDQAITELPETQSDNAHGRIFKYVAYAYKARAAMHYAGFYGKTEYYQVAADALKAIIDSGQFELWTKDQAKDPTLNFNELFWAANEGSDNKEVILSLQFIKDKWPSNMSTAFAGPGWKAQQAQQNYIDMFECKHGFQAHGISFEEMNKYRNTHDNPSPLEGKCPDYDPKQEFKDRDPRLSATFFDTHIELQDGKIKKQGEHWTPANYTFDPEADNDCYFYKKMVDPTNYNPAYYYDNSDNNYPLVRYSDMLLLYAEALNELGQTSEAVKYVNMVRARVDMPAVTCSDKNEMLEIIKHERKIELMTENQLIWDYKRWKEYDRTMPYGSKFYGYRRETFGQESVLMQTKYLTYPKYYLWPIPAVEMRNNKNMKQNPDW